MQIVAVIPAYNEEIAIGSVVLRTKKYVDRVIVVDDGSAEVAELAGAEVINGKAYALMRGFERAKELNCFAVITLDRENN